MKFSLVASLLVLSLVLVNPASVSAQSAPPVAPTVKILAIGTRAPGVDMATLRKILPSEVRETVNLYLGGRIDQWYALQDGTGVAFILNMTDVQLAREMLERLPLGQAHLMTFTFVPLAPLTPLRFLAGMSPATQ